MTMHGVLPLYHLGHSSFYGVVLTNNVSSMFQLMSQIDDKPGDRWKRKVGYEIERRIVKAIQVKLLGTSFFNLDPILYRKFNPNFTLHCYLLKNDLNAFELRLKLLL